MPRNITVTFDDGSTHVYQNAPDDITPEQVTARAQKDFGRQVTALDGGRKAEAAPGESKLETVGKETLRVADQGLRRGALNLPGMVGDVALAGVRAADKPSSLVGMGSAPALALRFLTSVFGNPADGTKFGDVQQTLETAGGALPPVSKPQTSAGKAAGNILETTVGTVLGGGQGTIGQKAAIGLGAGSGGEAAARVFSDNPLVRFLGSLFGGGAVAIGQSITPNSTKLVKQATEHMTDADWQRAQALKQTLDANGIPGLNSQVLGPRSTLDDVVATASANPSVRPKLVTHVGGAPAAAEKSIENWTTANLPTAGPLNRSEVLSDVQEAADKALRGIKDKSNLRFEQKMPPKGIEYDQGRVRTLYNSLMQLADDPRFGGTTGAGGAIQRFASRLIEGTQYDLSGVHPVLLARAQAAAKAAGQPLDPSTIPGARQVTTFVTNAHKLNNLNKEMKLLATQDDYKGLPISDIRRLMNQATPEFDRARLAKQAVMNGEYNPAAQGLTGQIAKLGGGVKPDKLTAKDQTLSLVFNPTQPQGQAIKDMAKIMGGDQVGELLREHINRTMQTVLRTQDKSPRSFVQALYESPAQRENIDAALEVSARHYGMNPDATKVGFKRLMESLDSFKDLKMASGVSPEATAQQAGQNVVSQVATPMTGIRRFFEQRVTAKSYNQIADLVTSKEGLAKLQAIARAPSQERLRQLTIGVLTSSSEDGGK